MGRNDIQYLDGCTAIRNTDDAVLIEYENEEFWIPSCWVSEDSEVTEKGDMGTLAIPEWLAKDKGMM